MSEVRGESPINPIPLIVVGLFLVLLVIEAVLSLSAQGLIGGRQGIGWRINAISDYGFSPVVWDRVVDRGDYSFDLLKRFFTYAFVHGSFTQALFGGALLLALGKFVGDVFHPMSVLAVFVASIVMGAVVYGMTAPDNMALFGVYPAVYGLIGAFTYMMWLRLGELGQNQYRAFQLIGFLMGLQLFFGLVFGSTPSWIADVAGFVTGLCISPLVAPGGWQGFLRRMRQR
jgi:rhomboid protease GluP